MINAVRIYLTEVRLALILDSRSCNLEHQFGNRKAFTRVRTRPNSSTLLSLAGEDVQVKATQQCNMVVNIPNSCFLEITQPDIFLVA